MTTLYFKNRNLRNWSLIQIKKVKKYHIIYNLLNQKDCLIF